MTRDELLALLLRMAQNSLIDKEPGQGCAWCGEEVPNGPCHFDDSEPVLHSLDCKLAKAIAWLEDEAQRDWASANDGSGDNVKAWVLR